MTPGTRDADPSPIPSSGRVLGLDWGTSRIGVAISDETQLVATPLDTLTRRTGRRLPLAQFLAIVTRERPVGLVVGLPLDDNGREGDSAKAARAMGVAFAARSYLPVAWVDESFTTARTLDTMHEMGRRPQRDTVDRAAAAELLQQWLQERR
jgi:putative holliday junction resolvase